MLMSTAGSEDRRRVSGPADPSACQLVVAGLCGRVRAHVRRQEDMVTLAWSGQNVNEYTGHS